MSTMSKKVYDLDPDIFYKDDKKQSLAIHFDFHTYIFYKDDELSFLQR